MHGDGACSMGIHAYSYLRNFLILLVAGVLSQLIFVGAASAAISDAGWQKGASFVPTSSTDFSSDTFKTSVQNFKAVGGTTVNLVIPYVQSTTGSTDIGPTYNTPTDASLVAGIQYVHSLGLRVMLSLYVDPRSGEWRANINPSDRNGWYSNYGNLLKKYAQIASQQGVEQYSLGAELVRMSSGYVNSDNTQRWNTMIVGVRALYGGTLTYSANRDQSDPTYSEATNIGFWDKLDYLGLSAYYELPGDGSVASLKNDWQNMNDYDVSQLAQKFHKPIIFTEVGYRSVTGAHNAPWDSYSGNVYDAQEQVNDYTALFSYWNNYTTVQGMYLWWWSPSASYGGYGNTDYTPQNKPAQDVLKNWWGSTPPVYSGAITFTSSAQSTPTSGSTGQSLTYRAMVTETTGMTSGDVIDIEIYQGSTRVYQRAFTGQDFAAGQSRTYTDSWIPDSAGTYTIKIGIFSSGWATLYSWNDAAASVAVGGISGGGSATFGPLDMWWPTENAHVSGTQPFQGLVQNAALSDYTMYWQVDGDQLNQMHDELKGYPHKEADIDVSGWHWNPSGTYLITLLAKNLQGGVIGQKSAHILVP